MTILFGGKTYQNDEVTPEIIDETLTSAYSEIREGDLSNNSRDNDSKVIKDAVEDLLIVV